MPISSHTSAPSYAPIVTSKLPPSFFTQGSPLLYKTDFRARNITSTSFLVIGTCSLANYIASFNNISLIDGQKSFISNIFEIFLLLIFSKHLITVLVFFHSFMFKLLTNFEFIWSNIRLLILPISSLHGFMSQDS